MPALENHHSAISTKLLLIGDSSTGKTGALASLAAAGYKLRIIDVDNGLDILFNYLTDPNSIYYKANPEAVKNVHYVTLTDPVKPAANGKLYYQKATVWQRVTNLLIDWVDGDIKLGKVIEWGPDVVLVIDSLSMLAQHALNHHRAMNGALIKDPTQNEGRRDVGVAQNFLRDLLSLLYDKSIRCNIVMTSHITFVSEQGGTPKTGDDAASMLSGTPQGYPSAVGRALSPHIPRWFNSMLICKSSGSGANIKRKIYTRSQDVAGQIIQAKTSAPLKVANEYPIESGLADYFKAVRGEK